MNGTYAIFLRLEKTRIRIGALGPKTFDNAVYVYVGSAYGTGGLKRVRRHKAVAEGERSVQHWHIDYILPSADWVKAAYVEEQRECETAQRLSGSRVSGFGSSDCNCESHLVQVSMDRAETAIKDQGFSDW